METISLDCPNCSAPLRVPLGEVETGCEFCGSRLRHLPGASELEVVRTREEMKRRERVEVQRIVLQQKMQQEEMARWREMAGKVAIAALPVVGSQVSRVVVHTAMRRGLGCGCSVVLLLLVPLFAAAAAVLR